jgi:DNA topoisomerase 2-associated protein PAT1
LNFEDTYDGLGNQLDETDDAFNDETFGDEGPATQQSVGKDFDFSGQTAKIAGTMQEEHMLYQARQPVMQATMPKVAPRAAASGYEKYKQPDYIPQLEANASLWGLGSKKPAAPTQQMETKPAPATGGRKMMSLEEVEASMRTQKPSATQAPPQIQPPPSTDVPNVMSFLAGSAPPVQPYAPQLQQMLPTRGPGGPPQILQRPPQQPEPQRLVHAPSPAQVELPAPSAPQHPQILQRHRPSQQHQQPQQQYGQQPQRQMQQQPHARQESPQPRAILQNPNRLSGQGQPLAPQPMPPQMMQHQGKPPGMPFPGQPHRRGPSFPAPGPVDPRQLHNMSEQDQARFLEEEKRRAKRNHKIYLLSKDNGLMTPQDKNYITRIQLTSLVTATGNVENEGAGPESALAEDFYYQVYSSIRTAPRQDPNQPVNQFAQTYLFATHGRYGRFGGRGQNRGDNHMQRMEQQVQRAVEVAKTKPKNKQLVIEGSLGKISFSNSKTPKPLLNIKRPDSAHERPASVSQRHPSRGNLLFDRKQALKDIENVYSTLLQLEGHERLIPSPLREDSPADQIQQHMEWRQQLQNLNEQLWKSLRVLDPIVPG